MTTFYPNRNSRKNCSFCHAFGHHVRNCSVLANNECGYCHNTGHTTRRCPVLAEKDQNRQKRASAEKAKTFKPDNDGFVRAKSTFKRRVTNQVAIMGARLSTFDALIETEPKKKTARFNTPTQATQRPIQGSWKRPLNSDIERAPKKTVIVPEAAIRKKSRYTGSWADAADADSDSDDDVDGIFLC